jgi:hydrogenase nickel incorporation protein HypA/HybF
MHEVSIALGMIDEISKIAQKNNAKKINSIHLNIGRMSGIVTDSLEFAFEALKPDYPLFSSATIFIQEVPLVYECNSCKKRFKTDDIYFPSCPACNSYYLNMLSGEEMNIGSLEVEV